MSSNSPWWARFLPDQAGGKSAQPEKKPEKYVIVPPMFERNNLDRDRFLFSSYEYQFAKRQLFRLFNDYVAEGRYQGVLLLSPPQEKRLSVDTRISPGNAAMSIRYQPTANEQATFLSVTAAPQSADKASFGASVLHPKSGLGVFATAPLAKKLTGTVAKVGLRYSSPVFSAGLVAEPRNNALSEAWLVGRYAGLVAGAQVRLSGLPSLSALSDPDTLRNRTCAAIAYEPAYTHASGSGRFSASVEVREGKELLVSFYQHIAQIRRHVNPLEDKNVVGITNYIDLGIQIALDVSDPGAPSATAAGASSSSAQTSAASSKPAAASAPAGDSTGLSTINAAASWQINKNWLLKCRVGDQSAGVSVAVKTWGQAGVVAAASVTCRYDDPTRPKYGATLQLENFGERRYERGASVVTGRAVLQRHEATEVDVANSEGTGRVVIREALESEYNPPVSDTTAEYL